MKILQVNSCVNSGSTGRIAEQIGREIISRGWESYIAYARGPRESGSPLIRLGGELGISLHGLKTRIFDKHGLGSVCATKKFISQIEDIKPDIVHLHNIHGYYINYEILFAYLSKKKIPVVWTLHDCWPMTGHCAHFSYVNCSKWKTICENCPQKKSYPSSFCVDNSKNNFLLKQKFFTSLENCTIVPVSEWLGEVVKQSFLSKYPIHVINNGVDINQFSARETLHVKKKYALEEHFILLGVATAWSERKGLDDYYKLSEILPDVYKIVLLGLTTEQIKSLPSKITGIERTENIAELAELYSAADIVLNLSREESFGLTTIEGFACGTPGIVLNATASPELITADTGFIVEPNDMDNLVSAIEAIKTNGKEYYSVASRQRAVEKYDIQNKYTEYITLYQKILKK